MPMPTLPAFSPLPFLGNAHVQTVLGHVWNRAKASLPARLWFVELDGGDALAVHETLPPSWRPGQPVVVLVHGMGGCHQSGYMIRVGNRCAARGYRVLAVDLRGAGDGAGRASRLYNAACSNDIRAVVEACAAQSPASAIGLVGFSLGGNIVLKLAGEAAARPLAALAAVAGVAPPIDLAQCSRRIERFPWYDRFFARNLECQLRCLEASRPDLAAARLPRGLTIRGFDEVYTAPRGGYAGALDYYARASALPLLEAIGMPALLLAARDDPFIPAALFEDLPRRPALEVHIAKCGGHLGFLGWDGQGGIRWAERFVVDWLASALADAIITPPEPSPRVSS